MSLTSVRSPKWLSMIPKGMPSRRRGWIPVFGKGLFLRMRCECENHAPLNNVERDGDSRISHPALSAKIAANLLRMLWTLCPGLDPGPFQMRNLRRRCAQLRRALLAQNRRYGALHRFAPPASIAMDCRFAAFLCACRSVGLGMVRRPRSKLGSIGKIMQTSSVARSPLSAVMCFLCNTDRKSVAAGQKRRPFRFSFEVP